MLQVKDRKNRGFTLTEVVVTMILISTLAAIAVPVFLNQRERGYRASAQSDVRSAAQTISGLIGQIIVPGASPAVAITGTAPKLTMTVSNYTSSTTGTATMSDQFKISPGTTVVDSKLVVSAGSISDYCLIFVNNGQYAKISDSGGLVTAGSAPTC